MNPQRPADWQARAAALDPERSFIVQAPAGSGKTELLTQRILALLQRVDRPEQILAITFTRKAAAEMKARLLKALQRGCDPQPPEADHDRTTWTLARKALEQDDRNGWQLLDNPARLQLQTIDSFCALLNRRMPWLSRFGAAPKVVEDPDELYRRAVERLLGRLEAGREGANAITLLLDHVDNQLSSLRNLLVDMLARRDQWLRHLLGKQHDAAREELEASLRAYSLTLLTDLKSNLGEPLRTELLLLGNFAADNLAEQGDSRLAQLLKASSGDPETELDLWDGLVGLLLTKDGKGLRKSVTLRNGFPAGKSEPGAGMKARMIDLLKHLCSEGTALALLQAYNRRPQTRFTDFEWPVLDALVELLPLAVAELNLLSAELGQVDFTAIAIAARTALGRTEAPEELLLQLDSTLRHILVDEFQDTSKGQYGLLQSLISGWERDDGRTLFLVGDPMQSIYLFREAEVGLFLKVRRQGLADIQLETLQLSANFRSRKGLVDWFNSSFDRILPQQEDLLHGAVPYSSATPIKAIESRPAVSGWCSLERQDEVEAEEVLRLIAAAQRDDPQGSVAILARSRNHLAEIVPALQSAGIKFHAQDLDPLNQRQAIQDLRALTRALLHPADRVCWLALLRAPWCGLTLHDLHALIGDDRQRPVWELLSDTESQAELFPRLSDDGQRRWRRIQPAIAAALEHRGRVPLRRLVESTWFALSGPATVQPEGLANAERYFALLEELDQGGDLPDFDLLDRALERLYAAPDPAAGAELQLMTIHKAKGLEFDTVILPGLGRTVSGNDSQLLAWVEHPEEGLLLAPMKRSDQKEQGASYRAIQAINRRKGSLEDARLLYVAVTRARRRLHLLGHLKRKKDADPEPAANSLLDLLWPVAADLFGPAGEPIETIAEPALAPPLIRLTPDWKAPLFPLSLGQSASDHPHQASARASGQRSEFHLSLRSEEGRLVGSLIHTLYEHLDSQTTPASLPDANGLRRRLLAAGLPQHRLEENLKRVSTALDNLLQGRHWERLFVKVSRAENELALHGLIDGELVHAVIDRTFVDPEGDRWLVDYKTSAPGPRQEVDLFLQEEADKYSPQLQNYCHLLRLRNPAERLRAALYFPLLDRLVEIPGAAQ